MLKFLVHFLRIQYTIYYTPPLLSEIQIAEIDQIAAIQIAETLTRDSDRSAPRWSQVTSLRALVTSNLSSRAESLLVGK